MKYPCMIRIAAFAAAVGAGAAMAQTAPAVMTDVGPTPAEERSSAGAIVLENSPVRAQRENVVQRSTSKASVAAVGRGVLRATQKAEAEAVARQREEEMLDLHRMGAGALVPK